MAKTPAAYLKDLEFFGIKLGLEQTRRLFELSAAPLTGRYLHIAGTNGKGSVGAMLQSGLAAAGFRTGFYSSPHLVDVRERFRIDGRAVAEAEFEAAGRIVMAAAERLRSEGASPTYFEFTTALAALIFARAGVDFIVWETGMGGRFDATNVVTPELSILTRIERDHCRYLGDTLPEIAAEKAGIIKPGIPVRSARQAPEAEAVIRAAAAERGAPLELPGLEAAEAVYGRDAKGLYQEFSQDGRTIRLRLAGRMQRRNAALALPVLRHLAAKYGFSLETALAGLEKTRWPGRCQEVNEQLIVDGAHNPGAMQALVEALREAYPGERFRVIFGGFRDKEVEENLRIIAEVASSFIFVPLAGERPGCDGAELLAMLRRFSALPAVAAPDVGAALAASGGGERTLAAGSLYLAGEILSRTAPETAADLN